MKVGVVGAGVMGSGVEQELARAGHQVVLVDRELDALDNARGVIERQCRLSRMLGGPDVDADDVLSRIDTDTDLAGLVNAEAVVENITEDWEAKRALHEWLDQVCAPECVIIANTSAIPITRIAAVGRHPERVIGVHFMNPVPMKPAAELIPGHHTSARTVSVTTELLRSMDKKAIPVRDACGFVSNRVLMLTVNEAAFLVYEGVASATTVDEVFRECFGHPMGPLKTADLIGVDTILQSLEVLYQHFADSKFRPCPLLRQLTDAGLHGRKTGQGFYQYTGATREEKK